MHYLSRRRQLCAEVRICAKNHLPGERAFSRTTVKKGQKPVQNTAFRAFLAILGQSRAVGYLLALADKEKADW
jgi:hypothetical protein